MQSEAVHNEPAMGNSSAKDRIHMWPHPAASVHADHVPCPSWGALFCTWKSIYSSPTAGCCRPLPDTGATVQLTFLCPFSSWLKWAGEWDFRGMLSLGLMQAQPDKLCQELYSVPGKNSSESCGGHSGCGQLCMGHEGNEGPAGVCSH